MMTKYLTEDERAAGRRMLYRFQMFNGLGFNFMGATSVYLLAIHFGANNYQLGYISYVIFLTGIILAAVPRLLAGRNLVKVQAAAWFMRGIVILFYLLLFRMEGNAAVYLILIVYTLFSASRMVGMAVWNPLVKAVSNSGERGHVIAQGNILNQSASVIARLISVVVTSFRYFSGITGILLLQVLGVIFNTAAVSRLLKIPCRETVEYTKGRNIFVILKDALKQRGKRYSLLLKWVVISIIVLNGLIVPFLKKEAGFGSNFVFLYSLIMAFAAILSALFARTFADRIGSRPLLIGMSLLLAVSFAVWAMLPVSGKGAGGISLHVYYIIGFFTNFFLLSSNILISRVVVNSMPEDETFSYNAMVNFVTALFSGTAGAVGGLLINLGEMYGRIGFNSYSGLFIFAVLMSLLILFFSYRLEDKGSLSGRETAAILFSFEGLRAYIDIGKMQGAKDPVKKRTVLLSISENEAPAATEELRRILSLPLSASKGEVIKSLFRHPRPALLPELMSEAADSGSYHQLKAIFALGAYAEPDVEKLLLKLLDDRDPAVRSNAAKSLGRIGAEGILGRINDMAENAETVWDRINYLIALKNLDGTGKFLRDIFKEADKGGGKSFRQTYYSLIADLYGMSPSLSVLFGECNRDRRKCIEGFIEGARDNEKFYNIQDRLIMWFEENKLKRLLEFCVQTIGDMERGAEGQKPLEIIGEAVSLLCTDNKVVPFEDAFAAVYFTYQILKSRAGN